MRIRTVVAFVVVGMALVGVCGALGCGSGTTSSVVTVTVSASSSSPQTPTPTPVPRSTGPLNLNPPDGYVYNGGGVINVTHTLRLGSNCTITGINFTGGESGIRIRGSGNRVSGCTFGAYSWAAIVLSLGNDNVIDANTFNGVTGFGANIQVLGGKRNQITNNITRGGITAIAFLYSRSANGGGAASLIGDSVVSGNTCSDFSEEGITFDVKGDDAPDTAALEYSHIQSVGGSTVTLSSRAFPTYVGYDMVFLSGTLAGRTRSIVAQSGSTFSLDGPITGAAAGNEVVIGATFKHNLVSGNTVAAASGGNAILLYGMAFGNRIENNRILNGSIQVESLDNLAPASGSVTGAYGRAPCGYNTIKNNVVSGAVSLEYYAIPDMNGHANAYPAYTSYGNNVVGNQCASVDANQQVAYIANNTGTPNYENVTLSPVEMVAP